MFCWLLRDIVYEPVKENCSTDATASAGLRLFEIFLFVFPPKIMKDAFRNGASTAAIKAKNTHRFCTGLSTGTVISLCVNICVWIQF